MKVQLKRSWTEPTIGKIYPEGTILEIAPYFYNEAYHIEVKNVDKQDKTLKNK